LIHDRPRHVEGFDTMQAAAGGGLPERDSADVGSLQRATGAVVCTLLRVAQSSPTPVVWPAPGTEPVNAYERELRREWSLELERHFRDMRRHARQFCPPPLLPMFEQQLSEVEATARAAVTARLGPFLGLSDHIKQVEAFQRRWVPYLDPPLAPPPRMRCDEADRSVWLDGRCLAKELDRKQFGFLRALVDAYPDPVTWKFVAQTQKGCRGANQTRLRNSLPIAVLNLLESGNDGYGLRLPDKMSTTV
jgi:hypothetical protein